MAERSNAAVSKAAITVGSNPTSSIRVGLKEAFNVSNVYTKMGAPSVFHFKPACNSTVFQLLKGYEVKYNFCTPFCTGTLDYSQTNKEGLFYGASSSGTVKALDQGEIQVGVCTDTGGSALFPSARGGYYCYRPTYGLISRAGLVPLCDELDVVSLISKNWSDLTQIYYKLAKVDLLDPQTKCKAADLPLTIKTSSKWFNSEQIEHLKSFFKEKNFIIQHFEFSKKDVRAIYLLKLCPSFFSNMCKFDGFHHTENKENISAYRDSEIVKTRSFLNNDIKSRVALGAFLLKKQNKTLLKKLKLAQQKKMLSYRSKLDDSIWIFPAEDLKSNSVSFNEFPIVNSILRRACAGIPIKENLYVYVSSPSYTDDHLISFIQKSINSALST